MLYDINTTKKLEKKIISRNNPELTLMFKAGTAIFNHIKELNKKDLIILIGPGNNGGDGYALAIQAFLNNYNINCIELIESKKSTKQLKLLSESLGIKIKKKLPDRKSVDKETIIIDAILGNEINEVETHNIPIFNLAIPKSVNNVSSDLLDPRSTWDSLDNWNKKANDLANFS